MDFEALLDQSPDEVISYLVLHGSKYLGSFNVKVRLLLPGCDDNMYLQAFRIRHFKGFKYLNVTKL